MELKEFARNHTRGIVSIGLAGSLAIGGAAFANRGESPARHNDAAVATTILLNPEQQAAADEVCPDGFSVETPIAEEYSLSVVGAPDALGSSNTDSKGNLISPVEFGDKILAEACEKPDYLASITAFAIEPSDNEEFPNAKTLDRVKELSDLYRSNPDAALKALQRLASIVKAPNGVSIDEKFFLIDTLGSIVAPTRDEKGNAVGEELIQINDGGFRTVFHFNYDLTDPQLNSTDKANREAVSELVGFDANGRMILKRWFGENLINLTPDTTAPETTEVATTVSETGVTVEVSTSTSSSTSLPESSSSTPNAAPNSPTASSTANTTGGGNGGGNGGSNGSNGGATSPDTTTGNGGGNTGTTETSGPATSGPATSGPGTSAPKTTPTTPNTQPPTTPNTQPPTTPATTTPETQPPTTPATTTPETQPPTTVEQRYTFDACDLYKPRNEGGFGVIVHFSNLTAAERDALLANPQYKVNYTNLGDSNGDGQVICK